VIYADPARGGAAGITSHVQKLGIADQLKTAIGAVRISGAIQGPAMSTRTGTQLMNAEPFPISESTARLARIAILWRGDEAARRSATADSSRFKAVLAALADVENPARAHLSLLR
jgi:hypothetical protein